MYNFNSNVSNKQVLRYSIVIGLFLILLNFISDWRNFKAGLFGHAPIEYNVLEKD
jgi:hypothetical protein